MADTPEIPVRDLRVRLADVLHETSVRGRITYITSRGRRVAAIVPVTVAEAAEPPWAFTTALKDGALAHLPVEPPGE